jgi:hypothetical protein
VPASAEIVLEGFIDPAGERARRTLRRPYRLLQRAGAFSGVYHRAPEHAPQQPIYHSTYTGKPPDEPAMLGVALNEVFVPLLQKQFPEIVDFYLPPEGCSYRLATVSIRKQYPGHAKRVMFGIWSFLRQFMYTKFIIVVDDDVDIRDWKEVIWAMTTRVDAARDTLIAENTPIDYLDFASPVAGLGSKMGIDATNKWPGETSREWGTPIVMDAAVKRRVDEMWERAGAVRRHSDAARVRPGRGCRGTAPAILENAMSNELIPHADLDGPRAWCHVIYGLHALAVVVGVTGAASIAGAFVFGVPSLLAVVLNWTSSAARSRAPGSTATTAGRSGPSGSPCCGFWSTAC